MIAIIDPITLTIVLSAVGGAVAGKKGNDVFDGLFAAGNAAKLDESINTLENGKDNNDRKN
ncbi:hypothetical protein [Lyngbya sp. CCY1209]|uniref:hypothetical protein n=1 Tax=Lyngbya sp. CCY1209 TaxID=2886103 RepID=UPI002D206899|nr:hypothetical protein [Lyngbya sp. CCY1209]MEB3886429.1 hypothetical protein [Lyngbya sp. CCY1209]